MQMYTSKCLIPLITSAILASCSGSSTEVTEVTAETVKADKVADTATPGDKMDSVVDKVIPIAPAAPTLTLSFTATKAFSFTWAAVPGATSYKLQEAVNTGSGYTLVKETTDTSFDHVVLLYARLNAKYILQSCNAIGCTASAEVFTSTRVTDEILTSIDYLKAGNTGAEDNFGTSVSLSADGNTLAVGAAYEDGNSPVINSPVINAGQNNDSADDAGAVYVFTRSGAAWLQQAYLKAGNAGASDAFGISVSLSADGNTLAVGAHGEDGSEAGTDNAGAVYVFTRNASEKWSQQDYLKALNAGAHDTFGDSVSLSADGNTLAVGASNKAAAKQGSKEVEILTAHFSQVLRMSLLLVV